MTQGVYLEAQGNCNPTIAVFIYNSKQPRSTNVAMTAAIDGNSKWVRTTLNLQVGFRA